MSDCQKCGKCCRVIVVSYQYTPELEEFFDARGLWNSSDGEMIVVEIPHVCAQLAGDLCRIHGICKPALCERFPTGYGFKPVGCAFGKQLAAQEIPA